MILAHTEWKSPTRASLVVVAGILAASVIASLLRPRPERPPIAGPAAAGSPTVS
jgi:hypothetical protein